jgi:cytokinin riboside 5'-monophosphate phosphoribohydrolase
VYCSSSDAVAEEYFAAARELGKLIAEAGQTLVFGGTDAGLMAAVSHAATEQKGRVVGIIPESIHSRGLGYKAADELIVTPDMAERKSRMEALADAFVALPGGFGTLEEVLQVITLKQLQYHSKPVVFINTNGFYDRLLHFFELTYAEHFAKPIYRDLYHVSANAADALEYLRNYEPPKLAAKWFAAKAQVSSC